MWHVRLGKELQLFRRPLLCRFLRNFFATRSNEASPANFSADSFFFRQSGRQEKETKDFPPEEVLQKQRLGITTSQITQLGHIYLIMEEIFPRKENSVGEILIGFLSPLRLCVKLNRHHHHRRRQSPCTTPFGQ